MSDEASAAVRAQRAKARALRAARAVSISIWTAALGGCASMVLPADGETPTTVEASASNDATDTARAVDAGTNDAPADVVSDAMCTRDGGSASYLECCNRNGWDSNLGCLAWGPFMPPAMEG